MGHKKSIILEEAVEAYFRALEPEGLSASSITSKTRTMSYFMRYVGRRNKSVRKLTDEDFIGFLAWLKKPADALEAAARKADGLSPRLGRNPNSLAGDRGTLRQFIALCKKEGWMDASFDPLFQLSKSKRKNGDSETRFVGRHVPRNEWELLLEAAGKISPTTRMIVALGLLYGRRSSEVAGVRWGDLKADSIEFWNFKRGRSVAAGGLTYSPFFLKELALYKAWYQEHTGIENPDLTWPIVPARMQPGVVDHSAFSNRDPAQWPLNVSKHTDTRVVTAEVRKALIAHGWSAEDMYGEGGHTLRRSFAVHMEDAVDLEAATAALDHEDSKMTARYTGRRAGHKRLGVALRGMDSAPSESPVEALEAPAPTPVAPWGRKPAETAPEKEHAGVVVDLFSRRRIA